MYLPCRHIDTKTRSTLGEICLASRNRRRHTHHSCNGYEIKHDNSDIRESILAKMSESLVWQELFLYEDNIIST